MTPSHAVIAVTFRCNAHCVMCNIWKSREHDALLPEHMRKLPPWLETVNISGGEPFLRSDLPDFVREIRQRCPDARITISTNAYLPDRIADAVVKMREIDPGLRLAVSLDGLGALHDRIRGDTGAFDQALKLIDRLRAEGFDGLRLSMTLLEENIEQVTDVARFAAEGGLELGVVAAHRAPTHLGMEEARVGRESVPPQLRGQFERTLSRWLRSWRPKQWLRAHFARNTYLYLIGQRWRFRCRAGEDFFFVQADGTVYSCSVQGQPMGDLTRDRWRDIWEGESANAARRFSRSCPESCWMICTARSAYRKHALRVLGWVAKSKLLAHLRRFRLPAPARAGGGG